MATHIADIELSAQVLMTPQTSAATDVLALLRWHGRPIGLMRIDGCIDHMSAARLRATMHTEETRSSDPLIAAAKPSKPASIVVCTHERPDDLRRCLDALVPSAVAGHEILVVDNAPRTTRTADLMTHYPFRYLCEPRIGLNNARNLGLRSARHPIVAYVDDDTAPDATWIEALMEPFDSPEVGCVTGLVLPLELETWAQEQFEVYCAHRRRFTRQVFAVPQVPPAAAGVVGMGANMAVRRDLALQLGGFDPRLDGGTATCSGGDTDMFARILEHGAPIVYTPAALVWHRHRRDNVQLYSCIFGYGVGLYSFLTKRLIEAGDLQAITIGARWFIGPLLKAAWRQLQGTKAVPFSLLLLEAAGGCVGPLRFWQETSRMREATPRKKRRHGCTST
jgi:GT2 family glycosyltransferase